jgi:aryl-alcohol dehydrogenase-like predicted oxidoreductase|tara:strand:+ start:10280 stop:11062 length:783 start_codon:yes stop_codon:yes gene_type:complete
MNLERRALGSTGIKISSLGLGTVKFGRNEEVRYPKSFSLPTDMQIERLLDIARQEGINLLDTAPAYGSSEQRIGRLLKDRDQWVISTKVGEQFITGKSIFDFSAEKTTESIEKSLRYLNTDYLDIVLIHSDGRDEEILDSTDCMQTLLEMKSAGKIRAIGMSTKTTAGAIKAAELCDLIMVTYNPSATADEIAIDEAFQKNKGVLIKKAFDSGHACSPGAVTTTKSNLDFALSKTGVSSVIVGTINPNHLRENATAAKQR